jgi:hypothetical protein
VLWVSFLIRPTSLERAIEAAMRASERSIVTSVKPGAGYEERCLITCFCPSDQLLRLLEVVRGFHRDREPPVVAMQDQAATFAKFQPGFCRVDWRLFDPATLSWRFHKDAYEAALHRMAGA